MLKEGGEKFSRLADGPYTFIVNDILWGREGECLSFAFGFLGGMGEGSLQCHERFKFPE